MSNVKAEPIGSRRLSAYRSPINRRGSIVILVLWSVCFLSVVAVVIGYGVRQKISLVKRLDELSNLRLIADAGVKKAVSELKINRDELKYSLNSPVSNNEGIFGNIRVGDGVCSVSYEYTDEISGERQVRYGVLDEESKININTADRATLERLFREAVGFDEMESQSLAASIIDWRDEDSELSVPLGSAEDYYYRNLPHPYEAKDAPFEALDELLPVRGMSPVLLDKIKDYVTVYGDGMVNVNTASRVVLIAAGLTPLMADKIINFRYGSDGKIGTQDDGIFVSQGSIAATLSQRYNMSVSEID
ncbi:MAG: type II secretion system protein GspK, partial [Candidatus Omnitrophica bacterium]|nr:type II secretion system protein GspK [Candidatus Omnitrophota bacterium]